MALAARASTELIEETEGPCRSHGLTRQKLDAFAVETHTRLDAAYQARLMKHEIIAIKANADEARDETATGPEIDEFEDEDPLLEPDGVLTPLTAAPCTRRELLRDCERPRGTRLGSPPALCLTASASRGTSPKQGLNGRFCSD